MFATKIEYSVGSEFAEHNKKNIRQVMAELENEKPEGFSYGVFMKEDGKSFVHLVFSNDKAPNVLEKLQSFKKFRQDRRESGASGEPEISNLILIGAFGMKVL